MIVTAKFRSRADFAGLQFHTNELMQHNKAKYPIDYDWSGTVLSFHVDYDGYACTFDDMNILPSLTVTVGGCEYYVTLGFFAQREEDTKNAVFGEPLYLGHQWIIPGSETVQWTHTYIDEEENEITDSGTGVLDADYALNYMTGMFYAVAGSAIPYGADLTISFTCSNTVSGNYVIDFDNLFQGTHPTNITAVASSPISQLMFPIMPADYERGNTVYTGFSRLAAYTFTDWQITGGDIGAAPAAQNPNPYRYAEGYDDTYIFNPKRLVDSMYTLGYREAVDFYVGASHYYDIIGTAGGDAASWTNARLNTSLRLNEAFAVWFRYYCKALAAKGYSKLVVSMSMENLHTPLNWCQKLYDGTPGQTGWTPPTKFFSPVNADVRTFYRGVCIELLDIVTDEGLTPILQLGEPWWWSQSFEPGDISITEGWEGNPPCFYDEATQAAYLSDFGVSMPVYESSYDINVTTEALTLNWLRDRLGAFSDFVKSIVKGYANGQFTVLFFPPSVLSRETAAALKIVNVPDAQWAYPALDFIQIEDYDWVIHRHPQHSTIYRFAYERFGYPLNKTEYFSGFVWTGYGPDFTRQWKLVENAAIDGLTKKLGNVYLWAGTQIRRDSWLPAPFLHRINYCYIEKAGHIYPASKIFVMKRISGGSAVNIVPGYNNVRALSNGAYISVNTSSAVSYNVILLETHTYKAGDVLYVTNTGNAGMAVAFINASWGITDLLPWLAPGETYRLQYNGSYSWSALYAAAPGSDAGIRAVFEVTDKYIEAGKWRID
jgi:hypothetical protein